MHFMLVYELIAIGSFGQALGAYKTLQMHKL